jgi:hypothetical protein
VLDNWGVVGCFAVYDEVGGLVVVGLPPLVPPPWPAQPGLPDNSSVHVLLLVVAVVVYLYL